MISAFQAIINMRIHMKEWINKISGEDIKKAYENSDNQYNTPKEVDKKIIKEIRKKAHKV